MIVEISYYLFVSAIAVSLACAITRLIKGPTLGDRINAADVVAIGMVALVVATGWKQGETLWLDVAMVAGLVLFVGTTAVSLYIEREDLNSEDL